MDEDELRGFLEQVAEDAAWTRGAMCFVLIGLLVLALIR